MRKQLDIALLSIYFIIVSGPHHWFHLEGRQANLQLFHSGVEDQTKLEMGGRIMVRFRKGFSGEIIVELFHKTGKTYQATEGKNSIPSKGIGKHGGKEALGHHTP